jgi:hypothetical protein
MGLCLNPLAHRRGGDTVVMSSRPQAQCVVVLICCITLLCGGDRDGVWWTAGVVVMGVCRDTLGGRGSRDAVQWAVGVVVTVWYVSMVPSRNCRIAVY